MSRDSEARCLSLKEAKDLFTHAFNPPEAFRWLLATGQVRIFGKHLNRSDREPIEDRLRRANEAPAFEVSIRPDSNDITLSLSLIARNKVGCVTGSRHPAIEDQLTNVFGARWRRYWQSGLTFGDVLVERASLLSAMEASGYMPPEPEGAAAARRPGGYVPAWIPFAEALDYVQKRVGCTRHDAAEALAMALQDGRIASRNSDTGEEIDARDWFGAAFVGAELLLSAGRSGEIRRVEFRREDLEKLWPDPAAPLAPPKKEPLKPAPENEIHQAITAVYDEAAAARHKPPNVKELIRPVQEKLDALGYEASGNRILEFAGADQHKGRRRKPGKTVKSEKL